MSDCPGADGLTCIDGYLYSGIGGMIFPSNKKCSVCNPPSEEETGWHAQAIREANLLSYQAHADGERMKVEGYASMNKEEFEAWLSHAKYLAQGKLQ